MNFIRVISVKRTTQRSTSSKICGCRESEVIAVGKSLARPADDLEWVMETYGNMLFRLCLVMLGNSADAEDALQEPMLIYYRKAPDFIDEEHRKAWLLTVAGKQCKDLLRFRAKHPLAEDTDIYEYKSSDGENSGILEALMTLPEKFRLVLILLKLKVE